MKKLTLLLLMVGSVAFGQEYETERIDMALYRPMSIIKTTITGEGTTIRLTFKDGEIDISDEGVRKLMYDKLFYAMNATNKFGRYSVMPGVSIKKPRGANYLVLEVNGGNIILFERGIEQLLVELQKI